MSIRQASTACVFCGGVVTATSHLGEIESTCFHCGYEIMVTTNNRRTIPNRTEQGGFGTYHIQYKNGYKTFGCLPSPIEGKDIEGFLRFINEDPSIDASACTLLRFDQGVLEALVGTMPPLYEALSTNSSRIVGEMYA